MTIFIPEWGSCTGRALKIARVFQALGDSTVVRKPLHGDGPDYFLEHEERGWLAMAVCTDLFADLSDGQLFESAGRVAFLDTLEKFAASADDALPKLLILWSCSEQEVASLQCGLSTIVMLQSGEQFLRCHAAGLLASMRHLSPLQAGTLRRRYFPETEISSLNIGRRSFHRDNSARLTGTFLDREQEWAAKLDLALPEEPGALVRDFSVRLLNGVAGSGKTLIALQRAMVLARIYPAQRILLLIHNAPVVADLTERLHRSGCSVPPNLQISTFAKWVLHQWKAAFGRLPRMPRDPRELLQQVERLCRSAPALRLTAQQLLDECNFLNDALVADEAAYLWMERAGRGFALREHERSQVWGLYQQLTAQLHARGLCLWSALARELCLAERRSLAISDHILVDEAQFMAPSALQVIKHALRPGGSMFLCADPRQGFLKSRMSWKSVGLDVAGRTKKLRRSYRTTSALLQAATCLLAREVEEDPEYELIPDFSAMEQGVRPILVTVDTPQDAVDRVVSEIAALASHPNFPLSAILVMYGEQVSKSLLYRQLCLRVGEAKVWWLNKDRSMPPGGYGGEHIRMANIDTATGLEGTFVFMLGIENLLAPHGSPARDERSPEAEARKLYMAMTRSCYRLSVVTARPLADAAVSSIFERRA